MIEIVFLGTGSAIPTRYRNLSGTALIRQGEIFLFDCGEATQIQFRKARLKPGRLSRIFISHFHGDHIFGLPGLLTSLQMADCQQDIHLYGPHGLADYMKFHQELCRFVLKYPLHIHEVPDEVDEMVWEEDGFKIVCRALEHRMRCLGWAIVEHPRPGKFHVEKADALGVPIGPERSRLQAGEAVRLPDGRVIQPEDVVGPPRRGHHVAYCVDTTPCEGTVALAKGADLLIHDATFSSEESDWAHRTGHSTGQDAALMAQKAGVRQLALTHLSGRFMPRDEKRLLKEAQKIFRNTLLARDLMRIRIEYED